MNKEAFYNGVTTGESLETIMERIIVIHEENQPNKKDGTAGFFSFGEVKNKIFPKVVSLEKGKKQLQESYFIELPELDLALTFYVDFGTFENFRATARISERHLNLWNVSKEKLHEIAVKNALEKYHFKIKSMNEVLGKLLHESDRKKLEQEFDFGNQMFVLADESSNDFGACAMYLSSVIENFAKDFGCDVFILPSSIHELILIPDTDEDLDGKYLETIVREVNRTEVTEEDFLSDSIYKFIRSINKIVKL